HAEGKAHVHATRVRAHRLVDELTEFTEGDDLLHARLHLRTRHAEDDAVDEDDLASAEVGVKSGAEVEQSADAPVHRDGPCRRPVGAGDQLEQGAHSAAVASQDADGAPAGDDEVNLAQCFAPALQVGLSLAGEPLDKLRLEARVLGADGPALEALGHTLHLNGVQSTFRPGRRHTDSANSSRRASNNDEAPHSNAIDTSVTHARGAASGSRWSIKMAW